MNCNKKETAAEAERLQEDENESEGLKNNPVFF